MPRKPLSLDFMYISFNVRSRITLKLRRSSVEEWDLRACASVVINMPFTILKQQKRESPVNAKTALAKSLNSYHRGLKNVECTGCLEGRSLKYQSGKLNANASYLMTSINLYLHTTQNNVKASGATLPVLHVIAVGKTI